MLYAPSTQLLLLYRFVVYTTEDGSKLGSHGSEDTDCTKFKLILILRIYSLIAYVIFDVYIFCTNSCN